MSIKSRTELSGKIAIIEIKGSLVGDDDTDSFHAAVADFVEQGNKSLIVNMQRVNYMNSSGIGALIAAHSRFRRNGGEVKLACLSNNVQNVLAVTKLVDVFDICPTVDEAIDGFVKMKS
jgi:anti-sigma B factor antagonist